MGSRADLWSSFLLILKFCYTLPHKHKNARFLNVSGDTLPWFHDVKPLSHRKWKSGIEFCIAIFLRGLCHTDISQFFWTTITDFVLSAKHIFVHRTHCASHFSSLSFTKYFAIFLSNIPLYCWHLLSMVVFLHYRRKNDLTSYRTSFNNKTCFSNLFMFITKTKCKLQYLNIVISKFLESVPLRLWLASYCYVCLFQQLKSRFSI